MRVILAGPAAERARLRDDLERASLQIVGEFPTLAAARASGIDAEALILSVSRTPLRHSRSR